MARRLYAISWPQTQRAWSRASSFWCRRASLHLCEQPPFGRCRWCDTWCYSRTTLWRTHLLFGKRSPHEPHRHRSPLRPHQQNGTTRTGISQNGERCLCQQQTFDYVSRWIVLSTHRGKNSRPPVGENLCEQKHRVSARCRAHSFRRKKFWFLLWISQLEQATRHQVQPCYALSCWRTLSSSTQYLRHPHWKTHSLSVLYHGENSHTMGCWAEKSHLHTPLFLHTTLIVIRHCWTATKCYN